MLSSNIKATRVAASGTISPANCPCHVVGYHIVAPPSLAASTITLNSGGSGGTALVVLDVPITAAAQSFISDNMIAGMGVYFPIDCYATLSVSGVQVTIFWY